MTKIVKAAKIKDSKINFWCRNNFSNLYISVDSESNRSVFRIVDKSDEDILYFFNLFCSINKLFFKCKDWLIACDTVNFRTRGLNQTGKSIDSWIRPTTNSHCRDGVVNRYLCQVTSALTTRTSLYSSKFLNSTDFTCLVTTW